MHPVRKAGLVKLVPQGKSSLPHEQAGVSTQRMAADMFGYAPECICHKERQQRFSVCNMASFSRCNPPRNPVVRSLRMPAAIVRPHLVMREVSEFEST